MIIPLPLFDAAPLQRRDKVHDGGENAVSLGDETIDGVGGQGRGEVDRRVQDLDGGSGVGRAEDSGDLNVVVGGAVKVVGAAERVEEVEGGLGLGVTLGQNLEEIGLTATIAVGVGGPARAVTVLLGAGNLAVQEPDSGHVRVGARGLAGKRHGELEQEDLVSTTESLVGNGVGAVVATVGIVGGTLDIGEDGVLNVVTDKDVVEDGRGLGTSGTIRAQVRERVSELGVPGTGSSNTTPGTNEGDTIGSAVLGVVVGDTLVVTSGGSGSRGGGLAGGALGGLGLGRRGSSLGGGGGRRSRLIIGLASPGVDPGHNLSINGGNDGVTNGTGLLLLGLGVLLGVKVLVAVTLVVRLVLSALLGGSRSWSVDGELLQLSGTTNVDRELAYMLVYRSRTYHFIIVPIGLTSSSKGAMEPE
jgi:hypothetical protein